MKNKPMGNMGVQDLCRTLKQQLDTLEKTIKVDTTISAEERLRRHELMEKLKKQLLELSI
jgi:hypothetical protein